MRHLLEAAPVDHATAIAELKPHIKTEENFKGLIPVQLTEFVSNDKVDLPKLRVILGKVEASW